MANLEQLRVLIDTNVVRMYSFIRNDRCVITDDGLDHISLNHHAPRLERCQQKWINLLGLGSLRSSEPHIAFVAKIVAVMMKALPLCYKKSLQSVLLIISVHSIRWGTPEVAFSFVE